MAIGFLKMVPVEHVVSNKSKEITGLNHSDSEPGADDGFVMAYNRLLQVLSDRMVTSLLSGPRFDDREN